MASIGTGNKRLLKLADFLQTVPEESFNLDNWLEHQEGYKLTAVQEKFREQHRTNAQNVIDKKGVDLLNIDVESLTTPQCGFAACAVGWACAIPAFRKAGLRMRTTHQTSLNFYPTLVVKEEHPSEWPQGFDAVNQFFGLSNDASEYMFNPCGYINPPSAKQVAKRIRAFVAKREQGYDLFNFEVETNRVRAKYSKSKGSK